MFGFRYDFSPVVTTVDIDDFTDALLSSMYQSESNGPVEDKNTDAPNVSKATSRTRIRNARAQASKTTSGDYQFLVELPGVKKDNLNVYHENGSIFVVGVAKIGDSQEVTYMSRWNQNENINFLNITANLSEGLLTIKIPREENSRRTIYVD